MATINGITIKSYREFKGIEYPTFREANVWQNGKKIGTYTEDNWGGSGHYTTGLLDIIRSCAVEFQKGCNKENIYYEFQTDPDVFMAYLLTMAEYEKVYKADCKKGMEHMLFIGNDFKWMAYGFRSPIEADETKLHESIKSAIRKEFPKGNYVMWAVNSLDDFKLTVNAEHPIPKYLERNG